MAKKKALKRAAFTAAILVVIIGIGYFLYINTANLRQSGNYSDKSGLSYISLENSGVNASVQPKAPEPIAPVPKKAVANPNLKVIIVREGSLVSFPNLKAEDPDGDRLAFSFSSPLNSSGQWQTKKGDAGTYKAAITVSDGKENASEQVMIIVQPTNNPPVIDIADTMSFDEGTEVVLAPTVTDADGDNVNVSYAGFMSSQKKLLGYSDAGVHNVTLTATDGKDSVSKTIVITVRNVNRPPKFVSII